MKKILCLCATVLLAVSASAQKITIDAESAKKSYGTAFSVTPKDADIKIEKNTITFTPKKEGTVYQISGYFNGQIVNKTKNTVFKLNNAYIENTSGEAAIFGEAKTEISANEGSKNYLVSGGKTASKSAAVLCKKNLEIGGSGELYVLGSSSHAIKADDVKLKGSGTFYFQGTKDGSAINCENLISEKGKTFTAYFLNSKNGIKADFTISIASGNFFFYDNTTALKTDTKKEDPKSPHSIMLSGGTLTLSGNETFYKTEEKAYKASGAKIVEK